MKSLVLAFPLLFVACSAAPSSEEADTENHLNEASDAVCAEHHAAKNADGDQVEFCDQPFAKAPFVRPPSDTIVADGVSTLYAGVTWGRGVVDRQGKEYTVVDANGKPTEKWPSSSRLPSNRNLYSIYKIQGKIGEIPAISGQGTLPSLQVTSMEPVIVLPGKIIDSQYLGAWEGDTAQRHPGGPPLHKFDSTVRVPVRLKLSSVRSRGVLTEVGGSSKKLPDGELYDMVGTIENWSQPVKASDGKCYPALTSLGEQNPFYGAPNGDVSFYRVGGMHGPGDQVLVIVVPGGSADWSQTGMTGLGVVDPASFLSATPPAPIDLYPHGMPQGNDIKLAPVAGGGGGC